MIESVTAKRFIQESGNRKDRVDAIVAMRHPSVIYTTEEIYAASRRTASSRGTTPSRG